MVSSLMVHDSFASGIVTTLMNGSVDTRPVGITPTLSERSIIVLGTVRVVHGSSTRCVPIKFQPSIVKDRSRSNQPDSKHILQNPIGSSTVSDATSIGILTHRYHSS
jgi:hypothetical protein